MIKCFLSHSSHDKESYVRLVANRIRKEVKVFDEETFEEGMSPIDEIAQGFDESFLFVIFLSNAALESKWVQEELASAKNRFESGQLERIYPIIIEPGISYDDVRIPGWMRDSLNIQPILKPTISARKINSRLMEISWKFHPRLKERKEIFVGRNELIRKLEERLDDFSQPTPVALIASGLPAIGRKSLLQHALRKSNLVRDSYEFPVVSLSSLDGIEDFILKTVDLGLAAPINLSAIHKGTVPDKLSLASKIFAQIADEHERILVEDRGVLVQGNGELVDWFSDLLTSLAPKSHVTFIVASQFRPHPSLNRTNPLSFFVPVKEMDVAERNGLLLRYSKFHELELKRDDYAFFADLLAGYPEQVLFAVDLIREQGIFSAKRESHTIQQYGSDKAKVVLEAYREQPLILNFIYLLCRFEFISYEALFDIANELTYSPVLNSLLASSVCERMGTTSDYVRVNEVVRDYVSRNRFRLPTEFEASITRHVRSFIEKYEDDSADISDYLFSVQESLRNGDQIPDDLIIPSVFVKTVKRLYDEDRNYSDAILLSDRVLLKQRFLHQNTINHIRYIKCQSLARLRDSHFFAEVKHVPEPDRTFLHGFYYRLAGDYVKAEESLARLLRNGRRDPRVIGELVLVYMQSDEYDQAFYLAKENYQNRSGNPINANNYFACLIARERSEENRVELESIIRKLRIDPSDRAQEMASSAEARLIAYYDSDESKSMSLIEETIAKFPGVEYPLLTKSDLAAHFSDKQALREAVAALERTTSRKAQTYRTVVKFRAMLLAMDGELPKAKQLVARELKGLIGTALQRLNDRLEHLAEK